MRKVISYKPSLGETALVILSEVLRASLSTFYPHPYYHAFCRHAHRRSLYNAIKRLERKNLIGVRSRSGREEWSLTSEGERVARVLKAKLNQRQGNWDKKWRLVIFDVPEKIRGRRDFLRKELHSLGFHQLQKSVWASPYPMPPEFDDIFSELSLGNSFRVVVADKIKDDSDLRSVFFPSV